MRSYKLIDLFAGCGGLTLGFTRSGRFTGVLAVEFEPDAADTYELNFGPHVARHPDGDPMAIEDVHEVPTADVVVGGPPCQGFSPLNMLGVGLERRGLWWEYLRILRESKAVLFAMENVPELLRSDEYQAFKSHAETDGFVVDGRVLNAAAAREAVAGPWRGGDPGNRPSTY